MTFYVVHATRTTAGAVAKEMYDYSTLEAAHEKYYSILAYDYNSAVLPNLNYFAAAVLDANLIPVERKTHIEPQPEPEPMPMPEGTEEAVETWAP